MYLKYRYSSNRNHPSNSNRPLFRNHIDHTSLPIVPPLVYQSQAGEVAALAAQAITDFTRKFLQEDESDEDPFASVDEEDERELEQNEQLIYTDSD